MPERFRKRPECPIDDGQRRWIDERWRWLEGQFGKQQLLTRPVLLPRPEDFPDPYDGSHDAARRLFTRVALAMDVDPSLIDLDFFGETDDSPFEGQRSRAAGLYIGDGDRSQILIEQRSLVDPMALVGTMAHELGHVHLLGHGRISQDASDHELLTDLLTVFFGFGVFSANSVIHER